MNMRLYNSISCLFVPLEVAPTSIGRVSFLCLSRIGSLPYTGGMNFYGHINKTRLRSVSCEATLQRRLYQVYYFPRVAITKYMDV